MICGNKCDLEIDRKVSQQEGARFAERVGAPFFETSAKLQINVTEAVHELIRRTPRLKGKEYKLVILGMHNADTLPIRHVLLRNKIFLTSLSVLLLYISISLFQSLTYSPCFHELHMHLVHV